MNMSSRILITIAMILTGLGLIFIFELSSIEKTRLVFCDVGQGDGILIQSGSRQVVIDGGPGNKMLGCLGDKMPFWDKEIEIVVLTHPQQDHMEGLLGVLENYEVGTVITTNVPNTTKMYGEWQKLLTTEGAKVHVPEIGDKSVIKTSSPRVGFEIIWPSRNQIQEWQENPPGDLNETSIVMRLDADSSCIYLTGDIPKEIFEGLIDRPCGILKIAHHGSRTGTSEEILEKAKPEVAVIQSGKNNRFGHPHKEVVDLLISKSIRILRNDTEGILELDLN